MKRFALPFVVAAGIAACAPAAAVADPPQPPGGCEVVLTTPAAVTGSPQGQANKMATFDRVCLSA